MVELKHYDIKDIEAIDDERVKAAKPGQVVSCTRVYIKSEADKVIAELKADYKEACDRLQTANLIKDEQKAKADKLLSCLKYLQSGYESILENLKKDEAGFASTQLHYTRDRFNELKGIQNYLVNHSLISIDENSAFRDIRKEIAEIIQKRLQERLLWLARGIDRTIESRKQKGCYKGEFDTATILANAFNDILGREYGKIFDGHPENE